MDHSLDESELDCRPSYESVWRSSETLFICAHLRRERLSRSLPPTAPSTPHFKDRRLLAAHSRARSTVVNRCPRGRSSHISCRTCVSTFAAFATSSCRTHDSDYFENHRQATFVQQEYAIRNPKDFVGYGEHWWGFTACDAPDWCKRVVDGVEREFFDYIARGAPLGPDDGTVAPWVVVASLPCAPEILIPTVRHFARIDLG